MRGPTIRIKYDVRRHWVCPACGSERFLPATETTVRCTCRSGSVQMKLVEPFRPARPAPPPLDLVITEEDCDRDDAPADAVSEISIVEEVTTETIVLLDETNLPEQDEDADSGTGDT